MFIDKKITFLLDILGRAISHEHPSHVHGFKCKGNGHPICFYRDDDDASSVTYPNPTDILHPLNAHKNKHSGWNPFCQCIFRALWKSINGYYSYRQSSRHSNCNQLGRVFPRNISTTRKKFQNKKVRLTTLEVLTIIPCWIYSRFLLYILGSLILTHPI